MKAVAFFEHGPVDVLQYLDDFDDDRKDLLEFVFSDTSKEAGMSRASTMREATDRLTDGFTHASDRFNRLPEDQKEIVLGIIENASKNNLTFDEVLGQAQGKRFHCAGNGRSDVRVHFVIPKSFNDAQDVADKFKDSIPVILNLQQSDTDLSKRLIDFASGLTYALDGGMQRIADKVFLLTPRNVEVSAEERARLIEKGFFNQS
jgi:FtsZ-interacting cell division protein YlmF